MGVFSTPYLHYQCMLSDRKLVSYENDENWMNFFIRYGYRNPNHEIIYVEDYSDAEIDNQWDIVLMDQTPDDSRKKEAIRLADQAKYIILHDANGRLDKTYHYSDIYPLFKYKTIWDKDTIHAVVLSNFVNLDNFWDK